MESTVLYKILSLKIDRFETDTGAGSEREATTLALAVMRLAAFSPMMENAIPQ